MATCDYIHCTLISGEQSPFLGCKCLSPHLYIKPVKPPCDVASWCCPLYNKLTCTKQHSASTSVHFFSLCLRSLIRRFQIRCQKYFLHTDDNLLDDVTSEVISDAICQMTLKQTSKSKSNLNLTFFFTLKWTPLMFYKIHICIINWLQNEILIYIINIQSNVCEYKNISFLTQIQEIYTCN